MPWLLNNFVLTPLNGFYRHFLRPRKNFKRDYGEWAAVTGATGGIGENVCYELAKSGVNVLMIGRNEEKLK